MKKGTMLTALLLVVVMLCSAAGAEGGEAPFNLADYNALLVAATDVPQPVTCSCGAVADENGAVTHTQDCAITLAEQGVFVVVNQPVIPAWSADAAEMTLSFLVSGDADMQWQRCLPGGVWEDILGATTNTLSVTVQLDAFKYNYRCTATAVAEDAEETAKANEPAVAMMALTVEEEPAADDSSTLISNEVTLVRPDLVTWLNENEVTQDMLNRAAVTTSLESLVIENDELVYVRSGVAIASYDASTGIVTDYQYGIPVGTIDSDTLELKPLVHDSDIIYH